MGKLNDWTFCPRCRASLEREPNRVECPECAFVAYANPSPTACAVCLDGEGRMLLVRRAAEVFDGYWDLPGGFVEENEHPLDTIRRELREETGLVVEPLELVGVWLDHYSEDESGESTLNMYWRARVVSGEPHAEDDISELRWFAPAELPPPDRIAFRNVREVLALFRDEDA